jgi:hypothetical protein
MIETMFIADSSPYAEDCVQVGIEDYDKKASYEAVLFLEQIIDHYGEEPGLSTLKVASNHHDFGNYFSIDYVYDNGSKIQIDYGSDIEADVKDVLEYWDSKRKNKILRGALEINV